MQVLADDARAAAPAPPHLLSLDTLTPDALEALIALAAELKADPTAHAERSAGRRCCCTSRSRRRARASRSRPPSCGSAGIRLFAGADQLQLGRGEPIADTARVVSRYCAAIVIRTHAHADVEEFAWWSSVPVVNALTDTHHPCQALADLLTLQEHFGSLAGLEVAYVGDGNNVAHSLMRGLRAVRAPTSGSRAPRATARTPTCSPGRRRVAAETGGSVSVLDDPAEAVAGRPRRLHRRLRLDGRGGRARREARPCSRRYQVDETLMARARPDAVFMHCLPAHRGEEVTEDVLEGPQSVVFDQAREPPPHGRGRAG